MATHRRVTHYSKVPALAGKDPIKLHKAWQRAGGIRTRQTIGCWLRDQLQATTVGIDWGRVGESILAEVNKA